MLDLVEICEEEQHQSPCENGNIVDGHACYCHAKNDNAPRKCPIWRNYGESDLSKWHGNGDFDSDGWDGGCKWFVPDSEGVEKLLGGIAPMLKLSRARKKVTALNSLALNVKLDTTYGGMAMIDIKALMDEAAARMETRPKELQWWSWPEVFGSTAGPKGGGGGQMMTTFQVVGFEAENGQRIKWCSGVWNPWDGQLRW